MKKTLKITIKQKGTIVGANVKYTGFNALEVIGLLEIKLNHMKHEINASTTIDKPQTIIADRDTYNKKPVKGE